MKRKNKSNFIDTVRDYICRQRKRDRDEPIEKRDEYWFLRGVYKSHRFMRETQAPIVTRVATFDMDDRMRFLDNQLVELANELNIPNRYRDWKLD